MIVQVSIPKENYTKGREGNTIDKVILHWIVGDLKMCDTTFKNPKRLASAHYGIEDTLIHQYVEESDTAWHAGNWGVNTQSIGIEHSGGELLADGKNRRKPSEETHKTSADLVYQICTKYNIPIDRKHILKHSEVSDAPTQCCGTLDVDYIIKLAKEKGVSTMKPSSKLPEEFYKINEAKELKKRKKLTDKDAFDTILANFIKTDDELKNTKDELEKQKNLFDTEISEAIKVAKQNTSAEFTDTLGKKNIYITQLETRIKELETSSSTTLATAKDLINKLKGIFGL